MATIKPVLHRILIQLDSVDEVTEGGIIIAKELIKKERRAVEKGTVVAIGETAFKDYGGSSDTVSVGDKVLIAQYSGKEVNKDENLVVVNDEDILVIFGKD